MKMTKLIRIFLTLIISTTGICAMKRSADTAFETSNFIPFTGKIIVTLKLNSNKAEGPHKKQRTATVQDVATAVVAMVIPNEAIAADIINIPEDQIEYKEESSAAINVTYNSRPKSKASKHFNDNYFDAETNSSLQCPTCKKQFTHKSNLNAHKLIHTGKKKFQCEYCKKSFTQKGNLTTHTRIHTGEKPFACEICKKSFTQKSNLKRHIKTHKNKQ